MHFYDKKFRITSGLPVGMTVLMSYKCLADVLQMSCRCFTAVTAEQRYVWNSSVFTFITFCNNIFPALKKFMMK